MSPPSQSIDRTPNSSASRQEREEPRGGAEEQNSGAESISHGGGRTEKVKGISLPFSYRFHPTGTELIVYYLNRRITSQKLPFDIIKDIKLYSYDPDKLPVGEFIYGKKNEAYFFVNIEHRNSQGTQTRFFTEKGYWEASSEEDEVFDGVKIIGFRKNLIFYWGQPPVGRISGWSMSEYRVNPNCPPEDSQVHNIEREIERWVICRIRYKEIDDSGSNEVKRELAVLEEISRDEE